MWKRRAVRTRGLFSAMALVGLLASASGVRASVIFDNFNTSQGHFTSNVYNASGSDNGIANTSTTALDSSTAVEGAASQKLSLDVNAASARLRHLSGGGTPANNVNFVTSSGTTDGWIGFYLKTTAPGWNVQLYIEPGNTNPATGSNGSTPKDVIGDGQWHLYEWNLDDTAGDADGWGSVAGIISGSATVAEGGHTIDSIMFRNPSATNPSNSTFNLDFVAKSDSGSVATLVPEPACLSLAGLAGLTLLGRRARRRA